MEGLLVAALFWEQVITSPSVNVRPNHPNNSISEELQQKNIQYLGEPKTQAEKNKEFFQSISFKKRDTTTERLRFQKPKTTVIFSPHPDDEILCCSNLIAEKKANNEDVRIIYTTNGDALKGSDYQKAREYGKLRKQESREATTALGLGKSDLFFLGFPDGQLEKMEKIGSVRSTFTDQNKSLGGHAFPYSPYTRKRLKQNYGELFKRWNVSEVYLPSEKDTHPDHRVTAKLVREVLNEQALTPQIHTYLVHGLTINNEQEKINTQKLNLIHIFKSQFWTPAHMKFMEQFAKVEEVFE